MANVQCASIKDLIKKLTNPHQQATLERIVSDIEYAKIYLSDYQADLSGKTIGTIMVKGTMKKGIREEYKIKMYHQTEAKGTFWLIFQNINELMF
jgi:hypothetical protein